MTKCKKKFQDNITIATQCSELIDAWKKVAESSKKSVGTSISSSTSQTTVSVVKAAVKEGVLETFTSSQSIDSTSSLVPTSTESEAASEASPRDTGASDEEFNSLCESLPANRKKVIELFTNILVVGLTTSQASVAKFLAFSIESSLNNTFKDNESYMAKFRSLSSNLKKNDVSDKLHTCSYYPLIYTPSTISIFLVHHNFLCSVCDMKLLLVHAQQRCSCICHRPIWRRMN